MLKLERNNESTILTLPLSFLLPLPSVMEHLPHVRKLVFEKSFSIFSQGRIDLQVIQSIDSSRLVKSVIKDYKFRLQPNE